MKQGNDKHLDRSFIRPRANLSRRRFLQGLGVCVALPAFESLLPSSLRAAESLTSLSSKAEAAPLATTATGAPLRMAFVYFPNGARQDYWWPKAVSGLYRPLTTLSYLFNYHTLGNATHAAQDVRIARMPLGRALTAARGGLSGSRRRIAVSRCCRNLRRLTLDSWGPARRGDEFRVCPISDHASLTRQIDVICGWQH